MVGAGMFALTIVTGSPLVAEVLLERMTSPELRAAISAGQDTVIIPTGGTEQNGGHMVLGKHNIRVMALSTRIAQTLGDVIVAPVIAHVPEGEITPPSGHMIFAGTLSVPPDLFAQNVEYSARSLRQAGFKHIILLGDSGWNQRPLETVAKKLGNEWGYHVVLYSDAYYKSNGIFVDWLRAQGVAGVTGAHAALADTSLMMAVDPSAVREIANSSREGAGGDPTGASAKLGREGVNLFVTRTVEQIQSFRGD